MKDKDFENFLEKVYSGTPDPYKILCAHCCLPFARERELEDYPEGAVPMVRRICECPKGQETLKEMREFARRKGEG